MNVSIAKRIPVVAAWIGSVALALGVGTVIGQSLPPKESTGVKTVGPLAIDLAPWAGDIKGRQLRIRRLEIAPGGIIGLHSHDDQPAVSYLAQGALTEYPSGAPSEARANGSLHAAGKGLTHWVENKGAVPAVLIVADIFKPQ